MVGNAVIIVAAGRGQRAGSDGVAKQFRRIGEKSVIFHAISVFENCAEIDLIQPVIRDEDRELFLRQTLGFNKLLPPVAGGDTRQQSVLAGLNALEDRAPKYVLIHDAARPFVSRECILEVLASLGPGIGAIPAHPQTDTMKRIGESGYVKETVSRKNIYCAQTPQGFLYEDIKAAHLMAARDPSLAFSDDASVAEAAGVKVRIVPASPRNTKITTAEDLEAATQRMRSEMPDIRIGSGYDIHRLVEGDEVILCGIPIPHEKMLDGHSDADVGFHALTDAILGAIGAGDIGEHFPPSDEKWRGASSDRFLRHAVEMARSGGGVIGNLDVTIICETPKIGPYKQAMRGKISEITGVASERVSVKATTHEGLGPVGRSEGIAAMATATVRFPQGGIDAV